MEDKLTQAETFEEVHAFCLKFCGYFLNALTKEEQPVFWEKTTSFVLQNIDSLNPFIRMSGAEVAGRLAYLLDIDKFELLLDEILERLLKSIKMGLKEME